MIELLVITSIVPTTGIAVELAHRRLSRRKQQQRFSRYNEPQTTESDSEMSVTAQ